MARSGGDPSQSDRVGLVASDAHINRVGVRELRNSVASVLRRAGSGERVIVTVDGQPIAQLGPLVPTGGVTLDDLAASGLIEPPRRLEQREAPAPLPAPVDVRLDRAVAAVRGD